VQVQADVRFATGRYSVAVLIEPRLGLAQPAPRLLGLPEAPRDPAPVVEFITRRLEAKAEPESEELSRPPSVRRSTHSGTLTRRSSAATSDQSGSHS
jgi:hypothetical protein